MISGSKSDLDRMNKHVSIKYDNVVISIQWFFWDAELLSIKTCKICIQGIDAESEVFVIQSQTDTWYTVHYSGIMCWIWIWIWGFVILKQQQRATPGCQFAACRCFQGRFPRSRACANQLYLPKYETREVQTRVDVRCGKLRRLTALPTKVSHDGSMGLVQ